jgi:hypothetical protein
VPQVFSSRFFGGYYQPNAELTSEAMSRHNIIATLAKIA